MLVPPEIEESVARRVTLVVRPGVATSNLTQDRFFASEINPESWSELQQETSGPSLRSALTLLALFSTDPTSAISGAPATTVILI